MLERLPESAPRRRWPVFPALLAAAVHAAIVLGVVELRAEPRPRVPIVRPIEPYRIILDAPRRATAGETGASGGAAALPARPGPVALPAIGGFELPALPSLPSIGGAQDPRFPAIAGATLPPVPGGAAGVAISSDAGVEPPELLPGTLGSLGEEARRLGLEGTVTLRCIVDASGRVEPGSIELLTEADPRLAAVAIRTLANARFRPGRRGGVPVRVQVVQRFRFALTEVR
jgi:TonB family protein